jgi:hypothetical protein
MKNNNNKKKTKIKKQEEGWLPWLPWGWPATPILAKEVSLDRLVIKIIIKK